MAEEEVREGWKDGWMGAKRRETAVLLLTYICLFVVLDEFSKLKVSSDNCNLRGKQTAEREGPELKRAKTKTYKFS